MIRAAIAAGILVGDPSWQFPDAGTPTEFRLVRGGRYQRYIGVPGVTHHVGTTAIDARIDTFVAAGSTTYGMVNERLCMESIKQKIIDISDLSPISDVPGSSLYQTLYDRGALGISKTTVTPAAADSADVASDWGIT